MTSAAPHSQENEMATLGSMILNQAIAVEISAILTGDDFYQPRHSRIFAAIQTVLAGTETVDPLTVHAALGDDALRIGGVAYLHDLVASTPNVLSGPSYARTVAETSVRRRLIEAAVRIQQDAGQTSVDLADIKDRAEQSLHKAVHGIDRSEPETAVAAVATGTLTRLRERIESGDPPGIQTGLRAYDDLVVHRPGQMIVVGARPGNGKSTWTQQMAIYAASAESRKAVIVSTEMTQDDMIFRVVSDLTSIDGRKFERGDLTPTEWRRITHAQEQLKTWGLETVDHCRTWPAIRSWLRRYTMRHGQLDLFVIDFLQRIQGSQGDQKLENRNLQVGHWADEIKSLALELGAVALVASQLRREDPSQRIRPPTMSDLRESGNIEQSADVVALLHRPEKYDPTKKPGIVEIHVEKHRRGETDMVEAQAEWAYSRFRAAPTTRQTNRDTQP